MGRFNEKFSGRGDGKKKPFLKKKTGARRDGKVTKVDRKSKVIAKPEPKAVVNPFEIKINKQKFQILGRPTKHERGLPGVSRAKALKKRQNTLLLEYKNKFKSNKLIDRRLGEKDPNLTVEGKMEMRFLAEKIKSQSNNKKSKFLLGDDEVLTHRGQTLADIEKFDDPRSESDDDDEIRLGKSFVSDAHFGGGVLKKGDESEEAKQNRESLIDNLIFESKKRKEERQKEKEETDDLTDKLDSEFKDVLDVMASIKNPKKSDAPPVKLPDSAYDILVRELRFEPRAQPADKLKSADEIARIEKEKLEKLEADRLKRMKGDLNVSKKIPHRSADDLDDGFSYNPVQPEVKTLSYGMNDNSVEESNLDQEDEEGGEEEEEEDGSDESEDEEDGFSDLASNDEEEDDDEEVLPKSKSKSKASKVSSKIDPKDELPFVFEVPAEYEDFSQLLQSYNQSQVKTVLERMIKSNHPALSGNNKPKMEKVFAFLMQFIHDVASSTEGIAILNDITPVAFDLAQLIPPSTVSSTLLDILMEKREEISSQSKKRPVSIATLVFLKLTGIIFPTSDFRHPVTTPAFHLLLEALYCPVLTHHAVQVGLGLCAVAYEYVSLSKRYIPEVINYLHGVVQLAIPRPSHVAAHNLVHPFRPVGAESQLLVLTGEKTESITTDRLNLTPMELNDEFRVASLSIGVRLLKDFLNLWGELPSIPEVYNPVLESLRKLPLERYNSCIKESVGALLAQIEKLGARTRKRLIHEAKKPKPLRLYEPAVEAHFDGGKKRVGSKEKQERDKLQHKLKREMKGAIREIRKDNAFIGRQKIQEQIAKDTERKRKVKDLLSSLAMQEGEVRKMKKPKKK